MHPKERIDACGNHHYYHINCLYKWVTMDVLTKKRDTCPTCSEPFPSDVLYKVNKLYNDYRLHKLYQLPPDVYRPISTILDNMIKSGKNNIPSDVSNLIQSYYDVAAMPVQTRTYVIHEIHNFVQHVLTQDPSLNPNASSIEF